MAPHVLVLTLLLCLASLAQSPSPARGEVVSEEIVFTPFRVDPKDSRWVPVVPGRVSLQLNGVLLPEEVIEAGKRDMVTQRDPELRLWGVVKIHTHQHESLLRTSGNVLVLRFKPNADEVAYRSYFGWRTIAHAVGTETKTDGRIISTNFAAEEAKVQESSGSVQLELASTFPMP